MADSSTRTPEEIRASIEANRAELGVAVDRLRGEISEVTDWRKQIARRRTPMIVGATIAGFALGGGLAAVGSLVFRRRRG